MARFETFDRDIRVATAGMEPEAVSAMLAAFARAELARVIQSGEGSPLYDRFVNGRPGLVEDDVVPPGPIVYVFNWWKVIIVAALEALKAASPRKSGRYQDSFVVIVDGRPVASFDDIPSQAEVIITNVQPYTRKIFTGAMPAMTVPARNFDKARTALFRQVGRPMLNAQVKFLTLPGGIHPLAPYILKGGQKPRAAALTNRSRAFREGRRFLGGRQDRVAGQPLTYPSLVMNLV